MCSPVQTSRCSIGVYCAAVYRERGHFDYLFAGISISQYSFLILSSFFFFFLFLAYVFQMLHSFWKPMSVGSAGIPPNRIFVVGLVLAVSLCGFGEAAEEMNLISVSGVSASIWERAECRERTFDE